MKSGMTKYSFLVYHYDYEAFLESLREVGVLHVVEKQSGTADGDNPLQTLMSRLTAYRDTLTAMQKVLGNHKPNPTNEQEDAELLLTHFADYEKRQTALNQQLQVVLRDKVALQPWGEIDWVQIKQIEAAGLQLSFYASANLSEEEQDAYNAIEIGESGAQKLYVTCTPFGETIDIQAEKLTLPQCSVQSLVAKQGTLEKQLKELAEDRVKFCIRSYDMLQKAEHQLREQIDFEQVRLSASAEADNKLYLLEGWCPNENTAQLNQMLQDKGVWYACRKATKADNAPIKFKNNAFNRMYEVLTKMYGMPDYGEFDPTPIVAPFFTLFFAFCMGDAGYGLFLIALGFYLKHKLGEKMRGMMNLVITLGVATTVVGAVLGTFFGVSLIDVNLPESVKQFMIVGKIGDTSYDKQMLLALIIGVVHISLAMLVKAIGSTLRYGFKESLSIWGWWILVVGFICTGGMQYFEVISAGVSQWAFIIIGGISAIGIYLLNNIHRNIFINIGAGLWDTYNMATGLMGDILSYIRLYALGLAGAMLGGVFNQLAFMVQDAAGGVPGWIFCGLILVFGHLLNIAMSCLSAFVHPLRLTFVEYFKNSGYEGKGEEYKPFAHEIIK